MMNRVTPELLLLAASFFTLLLGGLAFIGSLWGTVWPINGLAVSSVVLAIALASFTGYCEKSRWLKRESFSSSGLELFSEACIRTILIALLGVLAARIAYDVFVVSYTVPKLEQPILVPQEEYYLKEQGTVVKVSETRYRVFAIVHESIYLGMITAVCVVVSHRAFFNRWPVPFSREPNLVSSSTGDA